MEKFAADPGEYNCGTTGLMTDGWGRPTRGYMHIDDLN